MECVPGRSPESWLPVRVLPCDSGTPLWTPLLQTDKIISEVTEDCDSMHLPQNGDALPGASHHPALLLGSLGPQAD